MRYDGGRPRPALSTNTVAAISAVALGAEKDIEMICVSVGLPFKREPFTSRRNAVFLPNATSHMNATLKSVDRGDPLVVGRVLRATIKLAELYRARPNRDECNLIRLRNALEYDGYEIASSGDPVAALNDMAASASAVLADVSGIRADLARLEQALPDDPSAAIGRAKNLVEATAKAILIRVCGQADNDKDMPQLAAAAKEALRVHPKDAASEREQIRRVLGRLQAMLQDLAELRNLVGDGHGSAASPTGLDRRHGRLAVWTAIGWCTFMLDTLAIHTAERGTSG